MGEDLGFWRIFPLPELRMGEAVVGTALGPTYSRREIERGGERDDFEKWNDGFTYSTPAVPLG